MFFLATMITKSSRIVNSTHALTCATHDGCATRITVHSDYIYSYNTS